MTDEKFTELVNSYLDKEISEEELNLLKTEIGINSDRKQIFVERCRLHKAMRMALKPKCSRSRGSRSRLRARRSASSSSSSRRRSSRSGASTRITESEEFANAPGTVIFPRWMLASGLAACLVVGFVLLPPVFRDTVDPLSQPELVGVKKSELVDEDPLASLGRSELRRFALVQEQREAGDHASLVSQMRLMGLRPELTPKDKQLQEVDMAAVYKPTKRVDQAELFQSMQSMKSMPEPKLLRIDDAEAGAALYLEDTFEPSTVRFEDL